MRGADLQFWIPNKLWP